MSGTYQGVPLFWQYRGAGGGGWHAPAPGLVKQIAFWHRGVGASRGVQGRPGTNRLEWLENEFAALFVGGVNILRIFF